ncbi:hypothetical protein NY2A_b427L [Paramecium bursaria Chlorella virus NY2A]|uniref:Uncharacterized protein b427L n=1 Tax=Paramecium bursaria Chlorella virus NY2A TaxID=46021 RepID=A7IWV2_PBCVN|nr:hypothetical protein NY2A_b427L [Paramecium bursaria Chlorella virus NY2A]ABT14826.1 hypothetical protein NY2A_b427L [Paramecium bursaria Chlorella virus NY2A]
MSNSPKNSNAMPIHLRSLSRKKLRIVLGRKLKKAVTSSSLISLVSTRIINIPWKNSCGNASFLISSRFNTVSSTKRKTFKIQDLSKGSKYRVMILQ